jgi:DNA repair protein RadC
MKSKLKYIPIYDRPREKLLKKGVTALSDLELMAVLLQSGIKGKDVIEVSRDVLKILKENFNSINIDKLLNINGIGLAKAAQIIATLELVKRFINPNSIIINSPDDALYLVKELKDKKQEYFITLTIDGGSNLIQKRTIFIGTVNKSIIHPREVFADAITDRASGIFFIHNHPSGNSEPSENDINVTKRLLAVGQLLGIEVIDHIIIGKNHHFSFKENGML